MFACLSALAALCYGNLFTLLSARITRIDCRSDILPPASLNRHSASRLCSGWVGILIPGILGAMLGIVAPAQAEEQALQLTLRSQQESSVGSGRFLQLERAAQWSPQETAIIVCDVWDSHTCRNAVLRLNQFTPTLDQLLRTARARGVTIIHAPSGCMDAYQDHPARLRAQQVSRAARLPHEIESWCYTLPAEERGVYPLDQSDGGNDDDPETKAAWQQTLIAEGRNPGRPWKKQSEQIHIDPEQDFISDRGDEIWSLLEQRGIQNVLVAGVHTNMCVLGRPFGLRQLARNGKQVALLRDLTDTMYNPQRWPYVSHFTGNDLIVSHIERYVCPTISSDQILGGKPFRYAEDNRPHVVLVIAEDPYDTAHTLPEFALAQLGRDFRVTILQADEQNRSRIPGLKRIDEADVLLLSVRRRLLPEQDLEHIRRFVSAGKPVIGLRTSSHAFALRDGKPEAGLADWPEFDAEVFGGNYHGSYPDELLSQVRIAESLPASQPEHVLLTGLSAEPFPQGGHMYKTGPLHPQAQVLCEGIVPGHDPEPVAWTFQRADGGRSFYVALGHPQDFEQLPFQRLLTNAVYWAAGKSVPEEWPSARNSHEYRTDWQKLPVPGSWESGSLGSLRGIEEPGVYRCVVKLSSEWQRISDLRLVPGRQAPEWMQVRWNGQPLSADDQGKYPIPPERISRGGTPLREHVLWIQVAGPQAAMQQAPRLESPQLSAQQELRGWWQFRLAAADPPEAQEASTQFPGAREVAFVLEETLWNARALTRPGEFTPGIEGPACDEAGDIFAVNYERQGTIGRVTPDGAGEVFVTLPEGSIGNGIRFDASGDFFVADYTNHNVLRVNPQTKKITVHAHNPEMNQPNDLAIARDGTLYASDPNWQASTGQLWRIDTDGTTTRLAENMGTTNGIDLSPDEKTLYVNESNQRNVWAFTITPEKQLTDKRLIRKFEDHGFDGMRTDVDGNLYITRYGKGTVVKMSPQGEILQEIDILGPRPSNLCFGGPDGRTVYVTEVEQTRLVQFRTDRPGRAWQLLQDHHQSRERQ